MHLASSVLVKFSYHIYSFSVDSVQFISSAKIEKRGGRRKEGKERGKKGREGKKEGRKQEEGRKEGKEERKLCTLSEIEKEKPGI